MIDELTADKPIDEVQTILSTATTCDNQLIWNFVFVMSFCLCFQVLDGVPFDKRRERLFAKLDQFGAPPFTVQRLCELLQEPALYATQPRKFVFAVEKLVYVSTEQPVLSPADYDRTTAELDTALREAAAKARAAAEETAAAIAAAAAGGGASSSAPMLDDA